MGRKFGVPPPFWEGEWMDGRINLQFGENFRRDVRIT